MLPQDAKVGTILGHGAAVFGHGAATGVTQGNQESARQTNLLATIMLLLQDGPFLADLTLGNQFLLCLMFLTLTGVGGDSYVSYATATATCTRRMAT